MTPTRGSLTINVAQIWGREAGVLRPPHPPAFQGDSAPRTPQKALRTLGCSGWSLSRDRATCPGAAALPGAELLPVFWAGEEATCPGQLRCLGRTAFQKFDFLKKPLVWGSFAARGRPFYRNWIFWGRSRLSGAASLPAADFVQNSMFWEEATCLGQLRCLGQNFIPESRPFFL